MIGRISRPGDLIILVALALISILSAAYWSGAMEHPVAHDALVFERLARAIAAGHGYTIAAEPPYTPTMYREPLYPAFVAAIYALGGTIRTVVAMQIGLFAIVASLTYLLATPILGRGASVMGALAVALSPTFANYASFLLSEMLATVLLLVMLAALRSALVRHSWRWWLVVGIAGAALVLTRALYLFLPVFMISMALVLGPSLRKARLVRRMAFALLVVTVLLSPWAVRNFLEFGTPSMTVRPGGNLYVRTERLADPPNDGIRYLAFAAAPGVATLIWRDRDANAEFQRPWDAYFAKETALERSGRTASQADNDLLAEAVSRIAARPLQYLAWGGIEFVKLNSFFYPSRLNEAVRPYPIFPFDRGSVLLAALLAAVAWLSAPLLWAVAGMVYGWRERRSLFLLVAPIAYLWVFASAFDALPRFLVPVVPLLYPLAAFGILRLIRTVGTPLRSA